jgi:hypothetical protein
MTTRSGRHYYVSCGLSRRLPVGQQERAIAHDRGGQLLRVIITLG